MIAKRSFDIYRQSRSIRKGDTVIVIAGKDKGKKGKVLFVDPENNKCRVDGVNIVIKHKKARNAQQKSTREKKAGFVDISNVQIICKCGKATRISHKVVNGKKHRICTKCGEILDKKFVKVKEKAKEVEVEDKEKEEKTGEKKPLARREVKHVAESKIKKPQNLNTNVVGHRKIGGGE